MEIYGQGMRVHLGGIAPRDAAMLALIGNDADVARGTPTIPHPYTLEMAMAFVTHANETSDSRKELHLAVRLGTLFIGMCALSAIDHANKEAEIGYWLGREYWGKGYGAEAVRLMLSYGFGKLGLSEMHAESLPGNERSIRLLLSLGFRTEGDSGRDGRGDSGQSKVVRFSLDGSEFSRPVDIDVRDAR